MFKKHRKNRHVRCFPFVYSFSIDPTHRFFCACILYVSLRTLSMSTTAVQWDGCVLWCSGRGYEGGSYIGCLWQPIFRMKLKLSLGVSEKAVASFRYHGEPDKVSLADKASVSRKDRVAGGKTRALYQIINGKLKNFLV